MKQVSDFLNLYQHAKKNILLHLFLLEIKSISQFPDQIGNTNSWPLHPKMFYQFLIFESFYQTVSNQSILSIYSEDIDKPI